MPVPTRIPFKKFYKAVAKIAFRKYEKCHFIPKSGSKRTIEIFKKKDDSIPAVMWAVHEDKTVWSGDLKKACRCLEVTKKEFEEVVSNC